MPGFILTDAGNVLTTFKPRATVVREILAGFGATISDQSLADIFGSNGCAISEEGHYHNLDVGRLTVLGIWEELMIRYKFTPFQENCSYPLFFSLWCRHLQPIETVVKLYERLQKYFPILMVSNGDAQGVRHLVCHLKGAYGLDFAEVFISGEQGFKKPELLARVVAHLLEKDIRLADCVFIDDIEVYVAAAKKHGIEGICFDATRQDASVLERQLGKLGFTAR